MKIATWNVNSIRVRAEQLSEFLHTNSIDVILLQELKCLTEAFPNEIFEDLGYNCAVFGQKTYNGVAILSKFLIEDVVFGNDIFKNDPQARYIEAFINGYRLASVYVPNGQSPETTAYSYKLEFFDILTNHITNTIQNEKYIIGGDFNVALEDIDVYNPKLWKDKICCTGKERDKLNNIICSGLIDVARKISNDAIYTWWDYRHGGFPKNHGLRLDYLFSTENITIKDCRVNTAIRGLERPSDHAPIIAEID